MATNDGEKLSASLAQVSVDLLNSEGESLGQKTLDAAESTDGLSLKSVSPVTLAGAEVLVINVSHPGFTSFSRRIEVSPAIYLNAELHAVEERTANVTQTASISGTVVDGFTVSLSADSGEGDIQIGIPQSLLPEGTTSVIAELKSFDPNDPLDAQNFPGAYADTDGNNLVSVAFNYANIRTDDGQSLSGILRARAAQVGIFSTANADPVIINRGIPESSCTTLSRLGDSDAETAGFQIPVYSYDNSRGLWELLGHGTVYSGAGAAINAVDEEECESGSYMLEVAVTSDIFLSEWWNLDYPLVFTEPVRYCAKITLENEAGASLNGVHGFFYAEAGEFASSYFVTDNNGNAFLEVDAGTTADTIKADILFFGEDIANGNVTLSRDCANPPRQVVQVNKAARCQIHGKLEYPDGTIATRHPVLAVPNEYALGDYVDFAGSNSEGEFWLNATCGKDYTVSVISEETIDKQVNVNGSKDAEEATDTGTMVTLPVIEVEPIPTSLVSGGYSTVDKRLYMFALGHVDAFPLEYNLRIYSAEEQQIGTLTGTVSLAPERNEQFLWYYGYSEIIRDIDLNVGNAAFVTITGTITDSRNKTITVDTAAQVVNESIDPLFED